MYDKREVNQIFGNGVKIASKGHSNIKPTRALYKRGVISSGLDLVSTRLESAIRVVMFSAMFAL
jgi:hypothetical protein